MGHFNQYSDKQQENLKIMFYFINPYYQFVNYIAIRENHDCWDETILFRLIKTKL